MSKYSFAVNCKKVEVEYAAPSYLVEVSIEDVELDDIITEVGATHVLDHFSHADIAQYVLDNDIEIS
ncbi:MAG TPA: hypothetical protein EYN67_14880 [Flavobacteriales bacterium]|nr:hypothetical protein [Flavobacteriales bacterium]